MEAKQVGSPHPQDRLLILPAVPPLPQVSNSLPPRSPPTYLFFTPTTPFLIPGIQPCLNVAQAPTYCTPAPIRSHYGVTPEAG